MTGMKKKSNLRFKGQLEKFETGEHQELIGDVFKVNFFVNSINEALLLKNQQLKSKMTSKYKH